MNLITSNLFLLMLLFFVPGGSEKIRGQRKRRNLLAVCEGDCETNNDCDGDLICYHRNNGEPIPGCPPESSLRHDVCIPQWLHPRPEIEFMPSIFITTMDPPLQKCWGDCDNDQDCMNDLVCFQRAAGGDPIPGCRGYDLSRTDYCVEPGAETKPPIPSSFPNEYSYDYEMDLTLGYPQGTVNRQPTQNELTGARDAIFAWIEDAGNAAFEDAISYQFDRTEVTEVLSTTNTFLSAKLRAVFKANSREQIPSQTWYMVMLTQADGSALIQNLRIAPPNGSIFNSVNSESRLLSPITPTLPPGSTVAPATYIPPCAPSTTACKKHGGRYLAPKAAPPSIVADVKYYEN